MTNGEIYSLEATNLLKSYEAAQDNYVQLYNLYQQREEDLGSVQYAVNNAVPNKEQALFNAKWVRDQAAKLKDQAEQAREITYQAAYRQIFVETITRTDAAKRALSGKNLVAAFARAAYYAKQKATRATQSQDYAEELLFTARCHALETAAGIEIGARLQQR